MQLLQMETWMWPRLPALCGTSWTSWRVITRHRLPAAWLRTSPTPAPNSSGRRWGDDGQCLRGCGYFHDVGRHCKGCAHLGSKRVAMQQTSRHAAKLVTTTGSAVRGVAAAVLNICGIESHRPAQQRQRQRLLSPIAVLSLSHASQGWRRCPFGIAAQLRWFPIA